MRIVFASFFLVVSGTLAAAKEPVFVTIGEAFTSATSQAGIRGGWRMTTVPFLEEYCPSLSKPTKLVIRSPITLTRQVWFPYSKIVVLALDRSGRVIPNVPVSMEVEEMQPPLLAVRADMLAGDRVLPIATGSFRFRFATLCWDSPVLATAAATVRPK